MVDARYLNLIDQVAHRVRFVERPFGDFRCIHHLRLHSTHFLVSLSPQGTFFNYLPVTLRASRPCLHLIPMRGSESCNGSSISEPFIAKLIPVRLSYDLWDSFNAVTPRFC